MSRATCAALLLAVGLAVAGCGSSDSARPGLVPVALPQMASASREVQDELRARHAATEAALAGRQTTPATLARAFGELGELLLAAEFFDQAQASLGNAQALAPGDMRWPYLLGHAARYENDLPGAVPHFTRALQLSPDHVPTLVWLAESYLSQDDAGRAEPLLLKAQSIDAQNGAVSFALGRLALAKGDPQAAARHLEAALAVAPGATRVHYPLALAYRAIGETAKADAHLALRGEVDLPPADPILDEVALLLDNAAAFEIRGSRAIEARDWGEAVSMLRKAIALAPDHAMTQLNLGTALYMQQDADGALAAYRAALAVAPTLARAHFGVGVVMEARGRDAEAIDAFTAATAHDPRYVEAHFSLANALRRSGRVEPSLAHYEQVLALNPAVSQASFGLAMGLVRLGRYREARGRLEAAVTAYPDQPGFAHALARLLAAAPDAGVRDGARAQAIMAALLEQQQSPAMSETMAMVLAELGRYDQAIAWQRRAIASSADGREPTLAGRLARNLRLYQSRQPCRAPWPADDPVHRPVPAA